MGVETYTIDLQRDDSRPVDKRWLVRICGLPGYQHSTLWATLGAGLDAAAREISALPLRAAGSDSTYTPSDESNPTLEESPPDDSGSRVVPPARDGVAPTENGAPFGDCKRGLPVHPLTCGLGSNCEMADHDARLLRGRLVQDDCPCGLTVRDVSKQPDRVPGGDFGDDLREMARKGGAR